MCRLAVRRKECLVRRDGGVPGAPCAAAGRCRLDLRIEPRSVRADDRRRLRGPARRAVSRVAGQTLGCILTGPTAPRLRRPERSPPGQFPPLITVPARRTGLTPMAIDPAIVRLVDAARYPVRGERLLTHGRRVRRARSRAPRPRRCVEVGNCICWLRVGARCHVPAPARATLHGASRVPGAELAAVASLRACSCQRARHGSAASHALYGVQPTSADVAVAAATPHPRRGAEVGLSLTPPSNWDAMDLLGS